MPSNSREKNFICWAVSPLTMLGETGEPCGLNLAALADKLGVERGGGPLLRARRWRNSAAIPHLEMPRPRRDHV